MEYVTGTGLVPLYLRTVAIKFLNCADDNSFLP